MFDFFKRKLMTSKFGLTGTEKKLARKFGEDANIPIYRKGLLTFITGIQGDIYEQRQYAYNANIIISDEEVFDLSIPSNINKLTIKEYAQDLMEYSVTFDLAYIIRLCHNKQLINSHFYRGVSELPYKLLFAVIYTHLEFRYEVSHTITSHHVHHFHQTRIPDGTLLDYMVQYRKPLFPQFFLDPKKFLPENNPHHQEFHLRPYIQTNANQ